MTKLLTVFFIALYAGIPCSEQPPRSTLTATMNAEGSFNFEVSCPDGWKAVPEPHFFDAYNAKENKTTADAINFLANHINCEHGGKQ